MSSRISQRMRSLWNECRVRTHARHPARQASMRKEPKDSAAGLATVVVERPADNVAVVHVDGEVDMVAAPALESQVVALTREKLRVLVIDLAEVRFFSSAGLAVLVLSHRESDEGTDPIQRVVR
jgi:ABC-type transporter Mla MlaB component